MTQSKARQPVVPGSTGAYAVLPLRDIVVFPHMIVPLFVGREKSIRALEEAVRTDRHILLATQINAGDDDPATVKRVSVSAVRMGTTTIISIEDTGPGLPAKAREHLFSPFSGAARQGGTGLGLAIAHELVTAHGGTLELRDDRAVGTHFEIRLPDAPVNISQRGRTMAAETRAAARDRA